MATSAPSTADIAIIGAGAAGLAVGIFAAEAARRIGRRTSIILFDGADRVGAKILVSGGGRCNVTHDIVRPDDFFGPPNIRTIARNILAAFDERATVAWFDSLGVRLKREPTGKLFPISDKARTVLDVLLDRLDELDVSIFAGHRVKAISCKCNPRQLESTDDPAFLIDHSFSQIRVRRLILCTGGRSLPRSGSDGVGYNFARALGHSVTHTHPALVPLILAPSFFHASLSGIAHDAELTTLADNRPIDRRRGSLLWTHQGISGPLAMDASRHWLAARDAANGAPTRSTPPRLLLNTLPGQTFEAIDGELRRQCESGSRTVLAKIVERTCEVLQTPTDQDGEPPPPPTRLLNALLHHAAVDTAITGASLTRDARHQIASALAALDLPVERDRGWYWEEVTAGGVPLAEIDYRTMHSRRCRGLYLAGEILDCDGRIGGFNFQWAWSTAHQAGPAAVESLG